MKVLKKIAWIAAVIPALWACDNYEMPPIIPQTGSTLASPSSGSSLVLSADNTEEVIPFTVTAADFGMTGTVTYSLEMDLAGSSFANPITLGSTTSNIIEVTAEAINDELLAKGAMFDTPADVDFRVKASINQPLSPIYGETVTLSVTPYNSDVEFPVMYVPGDYQGWNPENEMTVLKSVNFDNVYEGYVHVLPGGTGEFKVNETNSWDINYGDSGADGTLDRDGDNIKVTEFGTFFMKVDLGAKTYTLSDPLYWGIIGDATDGGWDSETKMKFDRDENVLTITTDLKAGEMKFRANQDWGFNYGGSNGELSEGGPNIPVAEAGNYTVTLDFRTPGEVKYTLTKN
ncbi:SusF/SusE family outer membrane protein [Algoriphagus kandeliae]|uniref:SusF/SusE family outer membrane protein n=1 Tax=Algoriphagus kandeliae TaxID=2562278 RepID=A0A4Y9R0J3_9BACT|nr:SusE domain-containing protein [Algoriphagus kandeliae]TFV97332.1 SusF/SusE family outer membrane protein [Algoriphagus kandeliae]